jgi:hypothetical protein
MGGGGAQRPVWCGNELIKTGARSARARTRGQNTLVKNKTYRVGPAIAEVAVGLAGLIVGLVVVVGRGKGETALLLWVVVMVMVRCTVEREVLLTAVGKAWTCSRERGVTPVSTCRGNEHDSFITNLHIVL